MSADLVTATIDRLRTEMAELKTIEDALQLSELIERGAMPQRLPAAFVVPVGDDAGENTSGTVAVTQRVVETVGVVLIARHANDRTGAKARQELEPLKHAVRQALVGWAPAAGYAPFVWVRSRLIGLAAGAAIRQCDVRTDWYFKA